MKSYPLSMLFCGAISSLILGCDNSQSPEQDIEQSTIMSPLLQNGSHQVASESLGHDKAGTQPNPSSVCGGPRLGPCSGGPFCNVVCCDGYIDTNPGARCGTCQSWAYRTCSAHRGPSDIWWDDRPPPSYLKSENNDTSAYGRTAPQVVPH